MIIETIKQRPKRRSAEHSENERIERALADRKLIDRCLQKDQLAWNELYGQFHNSLILAIRVLLGRNASRFDLVDDIAAKVWYMAIDHEGALLDQFDAQRGCRLSTYLAGIARHEIASHFRSERRRALREMDACRQRSSVSNDSHLQTPIGIGIALREFLSTLSPRENEFCSSHLLATPDESDVTYSAANRWQLQRRVRVKLWAFLESVT